MSYPFQINIWSLIKILNDHNSTSAARNFRFWTFQILKWWEKFHDALTSLDRNGIKTHSVSISSNEGHWGVNQNCFGKIKINFLACLETRTRRRWAAPWGVSHFVHFFGQKSPIFSLRHFVSCLNDVTKTSVVSRKIV